MLTTKQCSACGQVIPPHAPGGQCPNCLLQIASQPELETDVLFAPAFDSSERQFGDYILGRQIGAGGMGVVYEAQDLTLNRKVAIKVLREAQRASPVLLCRFTIETEAAARLNHPNIVRVHEVGECQGHPFFSMDLIAGESLGSKISKGEFPFDWNNAGKTSEMSRREQAIARMMIKLARAVQHAHKRGVIHRDLKPGNVLIDEQGEAHLTDFGLAKLLETDRAAGHLNLTTPANLPGTPHYMSPEQASGLESTRFSDIYGLGAILYEALTGRPPFGGATPLETFKQILEQPPSRPRRLNPAVSRDLETICLKCLEKDPHQRFISAEALAEDLENWLEKRPINARPPSLVHRTRRWIQRNPVGAALIITLCLGLSISLTLLKKVNDQREEIEADRNQTFEEGTIKTTLIWDEGRKDVTISARELAILAYQSPGEVSKANVKLCLGTSTEAKPFAIANLYAPLLYQLQREMHKQSGETVAFSLKLFKHENDAGVSLANAEADLMVLSAVDYLRAKKIRPGVIPVGREKHIREGVIYAHTNSGIRTLADLTGKSMVFPDPDLSMSVWAKARLANAGILAKDLLVCTNIHDQESTNDLTIVSLQETMQRVLRKEVEAGVGHRNRFERYKFRGLILLDNFPDTPNVLAARQGLEPRIVEALKRSLHLLKGKPGFDSISVEVPGDMVTVENPFFEDLSKALQDAERFDGRSSGSN